MNTYLIAEVDDYPYALRMEQVSGVHRLQRRGSSLLPVDEGPQRPGGESTVTVLDLRRMFGGHKAPVTTEQLVYVVMVRTEDAVWGLAVERLYPTVHALPEAHRALPGLLAGLALPFSGLLDLDSGQVALIVDLGRLFDRMMHMTMERVPHG